MFSVYIVAGLWITVTPLQRFSSEQTPVLLFRSRLFILYFPNERLIVINYMLEIVGGPGGSSQNGAHDQIKLNGPHVQQETINWLENKDFSTVALLLKCQWVRWIIPNMDKCYLKMTTSYRKPTDCHVSLRLNPSLLQDTHSCTNEQRRCEWTAIHTSILSECRCVSAASPNRTSRSVPSSVANISFLVGFHLPYDQHFPFTTLKIGM